MNKHLRLTALQPVLVRLGVTAGRFALAAMMSFTVPEAHAAGFAFFPPRAIETLRARQRDDPEARKFFVVVVDVAGRSLKKSPSAQATLEIEGHLSSADAVVVNDDMRLLVAFGLDYRLNGNPRALEQAGRYLLAWANAYKPTGNPIDEEVFYKFVMGYELVREAMPRDASQQVDRFLRRLFDRERAFTEAREIIVSHSNFESRHLALVTAIAFSLGDPAMTGYCEARYREQISGNILPGGTLRTLFPDAVRFSRLAGRLDEDLPRGTTFDFVQRDAMEYHVASLQGLVIAAWVARNQGLDWIGLPGTSGQTLRDALDFTIPYATGAKTHIEFARTLATFDIERRRGGRFDPRYAQVLLGLAAMLDSRYAGFASPGLLPPLERVLAYSMPQTPIEHEARQSGP
jgi:hypothetical protein